MRDFQVYLEDIIGAIKSIEEYTANMTYDDFAKDEKTVDEAKFFCPNFVYVASIAALF